MKSILKVYLQKTILIFKRVFKQCTVSNLFSYIQLGQYKKGKMYIFQDLKWC